MTLAVVGTLSTNKQSTKQKETQKNTQFQNDVPRDNKYGNGFWVNFIEWEAQKRVPGIREKETRQCRIRRHQIDQNKTNSDFSKKLPHNWCFESNY